MTKPKYVFVYSEMDDSTFVRSLTKPEPGEVITREEDGQKFVVRYSWHWTTFKDTPVYMAELDTCREEEQ